MSMRGLEARNLGPSGIPLSRLEVEPLFLNGILAPFLRKKEWTDSDSDLSIPSFTTLESLTYMTSCTRQLYGAGPRGLKQLGLGLKKHLVEEQGIHIS